MAQLKLDRKEFKKWLDSLADDAPLERASSCNCPLARHLRAKYPELSDQIGVGSYTYYNNNDEQELPLWAEAFIFQWDKPIAQGTALEARGVLESIRV